MTSSSKPTKKNSKASTGKKVGKAKTLSPAISHLFWFVPEPWCSTKTKNTIVDLYHRLENRSKKQDKKKRTVRLQAIRDATELFGKLVRDSTDQTLPAEQGLLLLGCVYLLPTKESLILEGRAGSKPTKKEFAMVSEFSKLEPVIAEALQLKLPKSLSQKGSDPLRGGDEKSIILASPPKGQPPFGIDYKSDQASELWLEQILLIELPIVLAVRFPEIVVADDWIEPAVASMASNLEKYLDSDGWPVAECLPIFGPLLASWYRCIRLLSNHQLAAEQVKLIRASAGQLLRIVRPDGRLMFTESKADPIDADAVRSLLALITNPIERKMANQAVGPLVEKKGGSLWSRELLRHLENPSDKKKRKSDNRKSKPSKRCGYRTAYPPSNLSEFGESGILRASWDCLAAKVGIRFDNASLFTEICRFATLVHGNSFPKISIDDHPVSPIDQFDVMCDFHDEDVDYLEIQIALENNATLNRQFLLCHQEDVLMVADSVTLPIAAKINYRCDWNLAEGVEPLPETETREHYLILDGKIHALVMPISLPEWQQGPTTGTFKANPTTLTVSESITGSGLYVPLIFDLCPKRSRQKRTWRQLTVAESRRNVSRSIAAAFRFQLDNQQWFFYRSLGPKGNRTFLGENFTGEFVFSRFGNDGSVSELIRIE